MKTGDCHLNCIGLVKIIKGRLTYVEGMITEGFFLKLRWKRGFFLKLRWIFLNGDPAKTSKTPFSFLKLRWTAQFGRLAFSYIWVYTRRKANIIGVEIRTNITTDKPITVIWPNL